MEREKRTKAILELNDKINEYVHGKLLFAGGCCYSAYLLADIFKKMGIRYKVVLFQSYETTDERDFHEAINGCCDHVAIEVRIGSKWMTIGDYKNITDFYSKWNIKHVFRRYQGITPWQLEREYYDGCWNEMYDTANNRHLRAELYSIAYKYIGMERVFPKAA